jgi:regulatory subunit for Cdc7p protein kinase
MDVLSRGRQMGMKVWALEKYERILFSMLEYDSGGASHPRPANPLVRTNRVRDEDLSQVLRNEKTNGHMERDLASTSSKDLVMFKGPFIYIYAMDSKTRPIMAKDYPRVARRDEGVWPQFRSASDGKCPFIDDPLTKKEIDKIKEREQQQQQQQRDRERERERAIAAQHAQQAQAPLRPRSVAAVRETYMRPPRRSPRKVAMVEAHKAPDVKPSLMVAVPRLHPFEAPKALPQMAFAAGQQRTGGFARPQIMQSTGEPAASGIQRSNLTSAIRSQMISSTAAAPGGKAGTSKEVQELKRKVLERSHMSNVSVGSIPTSQRMTDLAGVLKNARAPPPQRAAKSKAQEKLGGVAEESAMSDDELAAERLAEAPSKKKKAARRDLKPGYCENCRDKYDDFDDVR